MDMPDALTRARFRDKVKMVPNACHEWLYGKLNGYGSFSFKGADVRAHRFAWMIYQGPIPAGMCVLHRCDNRGCVNPDHLFLGTQKENVTDMVLKGRGSRGEDNGKSKLTDDEVAAIRWDSRPHKQIAEQYGICPPHVSKIKSGDRRPHIAAETLSRDRHGAITNTVAA